jgi:hypothetical protein
MFKEMALGTLENASTDSPLIENFSPITTSEGASNKTAGIL